MLRLVLDWFDQNRKLQHEIAFLPEARWYSEALLASAFLPEKRGDSRAESFTHADGIVGHFDIHPGERGEALLRPNAKQLVVLEAKMRSGLSSGVKSAPGYDQAARSVGCITQLLQVAGAKPNQFGRLAFYVLAPQSQLDDGVFGNLVTKASIERKVRDRVAQYSGVRDQWYQNVFKPTLNHVEVGILTWEYVLSSIDDLSYANKLKEFYSKCLEYNGLPA